MVSSDVSEARVRGEQRGKHNDDDAGVDQWKRWSKCDGVIREVKGKEIGSPDYSRNTVQLNEACVKL